MIYLPAYLQSLTGVDVATASSTVFQEGFILASALVLNLPLSAITIKTVNPARRRLLSGVNIVSQVTSTTVTAQSISNMVISIFATALTLALPDYTFDVGAITVTDTSPTAAPVAAPGSSTTGSSAIGAIVGGVVGGVVAIMIVGGLVFFLITKSRAGGVAPAG